MSDQFAIEQPVTDTRAQLLTKRPAIISAVCILLFIVFPFAIWTVFSGAYERSPVWFPPFVLFSQLLALCCTIGYWLMRKWAVIAYACFFPVNQAAVWAAGFWSPMAAIAPIVFIILGAFFYRRMR